MKRSPFPHLSPVLASSSGPRARSSGPARAQPSTLEAPYLGRGITLTVASYSVNKKAITHARRLIEARQYVLDSDWGEVQPQADDENAFLKSHSWDEYAEWHLGLNDEASDETKGRYAFVYGDFRRIHRTGVIACHYRAAEWRHKEIELAAHDLLQLLDRASS